MRTVRGVRAPPRVLEQSLSPVVRPFLVLLIGAGIVEVLGTPPALQPATNQTPVNQSPVQTPANQSPANQTSPQPHDPAAVLFTTEAGMMLHAIKAASAADYELAVLSLKDALRKAEDDETRRLANAWRIYKAAEGDAKSNVIYVHMLDPAIADVDYRPSLWLDKLLEGAPADLIAKYRDAFAVAPTKLSLTEVKKQ